MKIISSEKINLSQGENKKYKLGKRGKIIVAFIVLILTIIIISGNSGNNKPNPSSAPTAKNQKVEIGDEGIINNNEDRNNCEGQVILGISKEALKTITKAAIAKDSIGIQNMLLSGEAFEVPNCTKVKVIDRDTYVRQVRILEGKQLGQSGWVPYEWVIK